VNVLFPEPFLPMIACVSPSLMVRVTPFKISSPVSATFAVRSLTSRSTSPFAARTHSAPRARTAPRGATEAARSTADPWLCLEESAAVDAHAPAADVADIAADI